MTQAKDNVETSLTDNDDIPAFLRSGRKSVEHTAPTPEVPKKPFECREVGDDCLICLPFDRSFRSARGVSPELHRCIVGLATIGEEVVHYPHYYAPSYKVAASVNASDIFRVQKLMSNQSLIPVIDRVTAEVTFLIIYRSVVEAVVAWFSRNNNENKVLCLDRAKNEWYLDAVREDLTIMVGLNGREVASSDECMSVAYRVDLHPNAIMAYGE